ncbi:tetratricopeptide repeat protein [Massilia terrae]|uniref:General secretion pathway protein GspD n=1 Tax=Massilia terrae TaxID=1811224 RepID=A0ABT2D5Y5_9BURK|nr:secretin N-terminal domain-containing protein [Massilia terrae]MCS0660785.1 general secretion pathway protein GspD [Massilia terrae]
MRVIPFRLLVSVLMPLLLIGCAAENAYRAGNELVAHDKIEAGLLKYREALLADPSNLVYKMAYLRARDGATNRLLTQADRELAEGKVELATQDFRRVLAIDPVNDRARSGLRQVEADHRHTAMMSDARKLAQRQDFDGARQKLEAILTERPTWDPARRLLADVNERDSAAPAEKALAEIFRTPISLEFRDAPLKQIFDVIAHRSGLNFLFDKDVKTDQRTSIFLKNTTVEAGIYFLLMTNQLERQVMDGNTILIFPNLPAKQKEYQQMTIKTFYIANAEAKNVANTLKTILKSRDVVVNEKLNLVILHDTPDAVQLASRLVALEDVPEPEVMLDVEVLQVQRNRLLDLGIDWPTSLQFAPLQSASGTRLTIDDLRHLSTSTIGVTGVSGAITASKTDGDANTLAAPRIRVRNKEKAKVVIGDKLPTITTTISSGVGGFASESVNYVDVGLKLDVEPTIYLNNEIGIRISLEVSNLIDTITTKTGTTAYRIGTRSAATILQLKDGENQVLAGLIQNDDRSSGTKLPGLGDLPLLGRLFGSSQDTRNRSEVVLSITPHLVRNLQRPSASSSEFSAGTETSFRRRPNTSLRQTAELPGVRALPQTPRQQNINVPIAAPAQGQDIAMAPPSVLGSASVTPQSVPHSSPTDTLPPGAETHINPLPAAVVAPLVTAPVGQQK